MSGDGLCPATITDRRYPCTLHDGHAGRHSGSGWVWWHGNGEACTKDDCRHPSAHVDPTRGRPMTAQEAAGALTEDEREALAEAAYRRTVAWSRTAITPWSGLSPSRREQQRNPTVEAVVERILADRLAALDQPTAATTGAYPCCDECGPGCSGHHERRCVKCQPSIAAMLAVADEGAARARGAW